jgi:hypothetical protein
VTDLDAYHELCAYTLTHRDPAFIHQHVVDAFTAQTATKDTKPIALTFALIGLYLHMERQLTGKQVQRAHQRLARRKRTWPSLALPRDRGSITAVDVLARPGGPARDETIHAWCAAVLRAFRDSQPVLVELLLRYDEMFTDASSTSKRSRK